MQSDNKRQRANLDNDRLHQDQTSLTSSINESSNKLNDQVDKSNDKDKSINIKRPRTEKKRTVRQPERHSAPVNVIAFLYPIPRSFLEEAEFTREIKTLLVEQNPSLFSGGRKCYIHPDFTPGSETTLATAWYENPFFGAY